MLPAKSISNHVAGNVATRKKMTPNTKALNTAPPLDVSATRVLYQTHHALVLRQQRATRDHGKYRQRWTTT